MLKIGSQVQKSGVVYTVRDISLAGVVELHHLSGGFAMYSHSSVCEQFCPPPVANDVAPAVTAPAASGQGAGTTTNRLANLDCHDRLVKRGLKVSYQGVRAIVCRVNRGRCCVEYLDYLGRKTGSSEWLKCETLQVVA